MKYIVQVEIGPEVAVEQEPGGGEKIEKWIGKWMALNPIGYYFSLTRRSATIIVDVPNEDSMFEALYETWLLAKNYPTVTPVLTVEEFPKIMERIGLG